MNISLNTLTRVAEQAVRLPGMYGRIDFSRQPERYTEDRTIRSLFDSRSPQAADRRKELLANESLLERVRAYTMLGDPVADAYAALIPEHGFRQLINWLTSACEHGLEAVPDAPPELVAFIGDMTRVPDWLDRDMVERGAHEERRSMAYMAPLILRGSFFATFANKYSALPMALTGALSNETAARRMKETATFFTVSTLPGALGRFGQGFKAAAMVRLMHSMVRFHALTKSDRWDTAVFGVPIPQVDQMPAGLVMPYLAARKALQQGRDTFTSAERALLEIARYRCFLLGMPEDLLPNNPTSLVDLMDTRTATIRDAYDDATCGALLRATMAADIGHTPGWHGRLSAIAEPSVSRIFFARNFLNGDRARAKEIGMALRRSDPPLALVGVLLAAVPMIWHAMAKQVPGLRGLADRSLQRKIHVLLQRYGHAEFQSDAEHFGPRDGDKRRANFAPEVKQ